MTQFTPGFWEVRQNANHTPEIADLTIVGDGWLLADINGPNYCHCEPNARLIAAAPMMHAILTKIVEPFEGFSKNEMQRRASIFPEFSDQINLALEARAILAKINGEQQ